MFYRYKYLPSIDDNENTKEREAGKWSHIFHVNASSIHSLVLLHQKQLLAVRACLWASGGYPAAAFPHSPRGHWALYSEWLNFYLCLGQLHLGISIMKTVSQNIIQNQLCGREIFLPLEQLSKMWSVLYCLCIYHFGCLVNLKAFSFRKFILLMICGGFLLNKIVN